MPKTLQKIANTHILAGAESVEAGNVRGSMIRGHIDWVRDYCDRDEVIAFFEAIPRRMRNVLVSSWYPFGDAMEIDRVIMNRFGRGELLFLEELGAFSARQNLRGADRLFYPSGVHDFFRRSAQMHTQFHDFGSAVYLEAGPTAGEMIHSRCSSFSPLYCSSAIGYYRECIRLHGGLEVDVWESRCQCHGDDSCTFELLWV